jgi:selenide,water dikinase
VLGQLPPITDPNVLVGSSNADDAGVYRITEDTAAVLTTDFFTPIVDDPYWFGAIAAANSLSDVYAMGARPLTALNIAMFPAQPDFFPSLKAIMQGGIDKMAEAGVPIIGGHTIRDKEPKYGFAVLGVIHPDRILDNSKARTGDAIVLTKKIGTGIISTGVKAGLCSDAVIREFTSSMAMLNRRASEIMTEVGVSTATDVTGFGLIGHLNEVLTASRRRATIYPARVPFFEDAMRLIGLNKVPGGTMANLRSFSGHVDYREGVMDADKILLNDAQTSGGLLIFVPAEKRDRLVETLQSEGLLAAHVGDVTGDATDDVRIHVEK